MNITVASGATSAPLANTPTLGAPPKPPAVAAALQRNAAPPVASSQSSHVQPLASGLAASTHLQGLNTVA